MPATRRLRLRRPRMNDFGASAAMWADPEIVRHISGKPSTAQQSWGRLLTYIGHWTVFRFGYWVVEERTTGAFVGEVGFANYRRDIEPAITVPELGWVIARGSWGKGYATEAAGAAIAWGRRRFTETAETACIIAPENRASIHVAEKLGFTLACETSYMQLPTLIYRRALT